jgi:hypothetical protein
MTYPDDNDTHLNSEDDLESNDDTTDENPVETEARAMGWKPLDEWQGPKGKWRQASEFVDRASFFRKIESQNRVIHEQNQALKSLGELQSKIAKTEREKVLKELNQQKREALREQEFDRADELDEEIIAIRSTPEPSFQVPNVQFEQPNQEDPNEVLAEFKARNEWFETDPELTELAETLAGGYVVRARQAGKQPAPREIFEYVEKKVREITKKPKAGADPVMGSNTTTRAKEGASSGKHKYTVKNLDDETRTIAKRLVEAGAFKNVQEYVDVLAAAGELN